MLFEEKINKLLECHESNDMFGFYTMIVSCFDDPKFDLNLFRNKTETVIGLIAEFIRKYQKHNKEDIIIESLLDLNDNDIIDQVIMISNMKYKPNHLLEIFNSYPEKYPNFILLLNERIK